MELEALREEFQNRKRDLLPSDINSMDELENQADAAWNELDEAIRQEIENNRTAAAAVASGTVFTPAMKASIVDLARKQFDDLNDALVKINNWSAFTRMHYRVRRGIEDVFRWGVIALILIGAFSWSVSSQKDKHGASSIVVIGNLTPVTDGGVDLPIIKPIQFVTGKWDLSKRAIEIIGTARDYLRSHPETAVLVFAYTDTRGGSKVNRSLAANRADAVVRALKAEGGISASRVFVTSLPKTDLPVLTAQEVDSDANRSVQLMLFPMPARK
jgi:outer membrane protein OmpA-like peptidoglycan-associated protein